MHGPFWPWQFFIEQDAYIAPKPPPAGVRSLIVMMAV
jgi:hypothetical protein